ncbi:unnamed protein product [Lactuca virosa]|uniref:Uncharacterized protein n=1 Tax=Lactuca virosa TaxID=75947 RepID=A0AAU9MR34_9ASTR|nr:unnamed protein product [Lactuca virosa]
MEHGVISMEQGVDRYKIVFLSKITYIEKCLDVVATLQAKKDSDEERPLLANLNIMVNVHSFTITFMPFK